MTNKQAQAAPKDKSDSGPAPKQPCEVAIWHVVPCIRACLSRELVEKDLTQQKVGDLLGISQAAVSQYVGEKRGNISQKDPRTYQMVTELADDLVKGEVSDLSERICEICRTVQQNEQLLGYCGVPEEQVDQITVCKG
ncbi:transcriptional regulator [Candidatus Bipolaricaulota bacterium]|nr:transcriptional regulator [Candidatus Bipolaricaulota bacterium]